MIAEPKKAKDRDPNTSVGATKRRLTKLLRTLFRHPILFQLSSQRCLQEIQNTLIRQFHCGQRLPGKPPREFSVLRGLIFGWTARNEGRQQCDLQHRCHRFRVQC